MKRVYAILSLALAAMSAATAQPSVQFTPDSLTRGLWHFNETSGSVVHDTASGYDGTAVGTTIVPGKFGNARAFNGAGDYVLVPSSTAFDFDTSGFRVDVWFRALTGNTQIIRRGLAPDPGFMIFLQSTGQVLGTIGNRGDSSYPDTTLNVISTSTYLDGAWHLATLIRDRTARKLELFVDGISAATPIDDNFSIPLNSTDPLTIGRWESNVYPYYFSGQIDEVRISGSKPLPPAPVISVQPTTLNYGWVKALSSDTLSLQINNFGHRDSLRVTSIITGNPLFGVSASAFVIPPFGSRTISVWYSPTQGKAFGDTSVLQIASNDPVHPTSGVLLEGFGYAPNPPTAPFTADSATRGLWHIDEATGPTVYDSAAGNNGTAFGTTIVPGRFGNARSFNGNGDYVTIPSSTMFDFDTSSFSVDLWFRSTQTGGVILRRGLAPDPGFMISLFQNGRVVGMIGNRSDSYYPDELLSDTSVVSYNDSAWHEVRMVRDRTAKRLFLYVDGVLAGNPAVDNFTIPLNSTDPLTIGRWESTVYPAWFTGSVDEIKISSPKIVRFPVAISVSQSKLDFGLNRVSSKDTLLLQVTNGGYRDSLRVTSITSNNPRFTVSGAPMTLPRGTSHLFAVQYAPTASQVDTGTVTIASSDPRSPVTRVSVSGEGYAIQARPFITGIALVPYTYYQARIIWIRSVYDTLASADSVTGYSVWHQILTGGGASPAGNSGSSHSGPSYTPGAAWEYVLTVPPIGVDQYAVTVQLPSTFYNTSSWQVYMVVAQTKNLNAYLSLPDSIKGLLPTGIAAQPGGQIPDKLTLQQNYPNPFNPSTIIRYGLPAKTALTLVVYNMLGQEVATLVNGEQEAGFHEVRFDGSGLASGVYFYRLRAGMSVRTEKFLLLK